MLRALVENLPGSSEKYEQNASGRIFKEFDLPAGISWPFYYGFLQDTLAPDGDPLDVFIVTEQEYARGAIVEVEVIDSLEYIDRGEEDPKTIAIPTGVHAPVEAELEGIIVSIKRFLKLFKEAKGHEYTLGLPRGKVATQHLVADSQSRWRKSDA